MDYKKILRNKACRLQDLLNKYGQNLSQENIDAIKILIDNVYGITNASLDAVDYDIRNKGIMEYHSMLDTAMSKFRQFTEREQDKQTNAREES